MEKNIHTHPFDSVVIIIGSDNNPFKAPSRVNAVIRINIGLIKIF